jgi:HYR domain
MMNADGSRPTNLTNSANAGEVEADWGNIEDTTAPMLDLPVDITEVATSASGATVSFTATATDDVDGSVPVDCSSASGSLFATGTTQVSCSATDAAGNQASGFFQVKVVYDFGNGSGGGFGEPVRDTELNKLAAGAGVPVKFGLGADYGLNTFAVGYPASNKVDCSTGRTLRDPPHTLTGVRRSCSPSVETRHRWRPHRTGSGGRRGRPAPRWGIYVACFRSAVAYPYCGRPAVR